MKRRWNIALWAGSLVVLAALLTYFPLFVRFPATRDLPWPTLSMFIAGLALIAIGLRRADREPQVYGGKIAGTILGSVGVVLFALFAFGIFYLMRQIPASRGAPQVGHKAPDFTLPDKDGNPVALSGLLGSGGTGSRGVNGVLLVFYRGYW